MSLLIIAFLPVRVSADLNVDIKVPELGPGMAQLEGVLAENVLLAADEVKIFAENLLEKPELTRGFGNAVSLVSTVPMLGTLPLASRTSLSMGGYASFYSYTLDESALSERFSNLNEEDDFEIGISARLVNTSLTLPLNRLVPGLSLFASAGYAKLESESFYLNDFFVQTALGYSLFREFGRKNVFRWSPLYLQMGGSYAYHSLGAIISVGTVTQDFTVDPDGKGPLLGQDVTVEVNPVVDLSMLSHVGSYIFAVTTGIRLMDTLHLYIGSGCSLSFGRTDIALSNDNDVIVRGYLSDLVEEEGSIGIDGSVVGSSPRVFMGYFFTGFQLEISKMFINVPILYDPSSGLSTGISLGVSL